MARTKTTKTDLARVMAEILDDYAADVSADLTDVIHTVAPEAVNQLANKSPKLTGDYARGWTTLYETGNNVESLIIHNETDWQLTHLLENGHALRNGGRSRAFKHIKPVEQWVEAQTVKEIERKLKG